MPFKRPRSMTYGRFKSLRARSYFKRRRFGPQRRTRRRIGTGAGRMNMVKRVILSMAERKFRVTNHDVGAMNHAIVHELRLIDNTTSTTILPPNGDLDTNRNGSAIYATGVMIRGQMSVPFDRRNVKVKVWAVEYDNVDGNPVNDWFLTNNGDLINNPVNFRRFKPMLQKSYRVKARDLYVERGEVTDAGAEATIYYSIWIPFKRHIQFTTGTSQVAAKGMRDRLSLVFLPYDTYDTEITDTVITRNRCTSILYFRDP